MSPFVTFLIQVLLSVGSSFLGAHLAWASATRLERRKEGRARYAAAMMLQADLIRLHRRLKNHHGILQGYAGTMTNRIDAEAARKFTPVAIDRSFPVYRACLKELGLMEAATVANVVHCYGNTSDLLDDQDAFGLQLPTLENSNTIGYRADNLAHAEAAIMTLVCRTVPLLASISEPLPFTLEAG